MGHQISVGGLTLDHPSTYFFDARCGLPNDEPAAIDFALPVAPNSYVPADRELPYWPKYSVLSPGQRRIYLEWLAAGRQPAPPELGYTFIFIYGLERRSLVEGSDHKFVFDELLRLRHLYSEAERPSRSFDNYTLSLLCFLIVLAPQVIALKRIRRLVESVEVWAEENLAAVLAWFALTNTAVPDWAAFAVARILPQSQRSVVINRVGEEFQRYFEKRYVESCGAGMRLQVSKRERKYAYRPASAALPAMSFTAANPWGISKQFRILSALWNEGIAKLRKLSSAVAKSEGELTIAAWEAMPVQLKACTDHPLATPFCELVNSHMSDAGRSVLSAAALTAALEMPGGDRITPALARKLCARARDVGYNLEPDAHLTGKGYRGDEPIAVFLKLSEEPVDPGRYNAAACMLRIGLAVAGADGAVSEERGAAVVSHVRSAFELTEDEQRRLDALRGLLAAREADLSGLGKLAKSLSLPQREMIGKLAIALAAEDGVITAPELRALRKCSTALGLDRQHVDEALRSLMAKGTTRDEPVTVQIAGARSAGEQIPPPPERARAKADGELRLDRAAIAAIMKDTQEVARMLASAMGADSGDEVPGPQSLEISPKEEVFASSPVAPNAKPEAQVPSPTPASPDVLLVAPGPPVVAAPDLSLPQRYAAFYQILLAKNGVWTIKEADGVARQHGHMLAGAIETLNEWALARYGGQLFIEDGSHLVVERELLN